jgi:hypothetical protein
MKRVGILLFVLLLGYPVETHAESFPYKQWFVVDTLNGKNVRDKMLTFIASTLSPSIPLRRPPMALLGAMNGAPDGTLIIKPASC